jgi:hypothetical protein
MKSEAPLPHQRERAARSVAPDREEAPSFSKPARSAFDCVRHDARSATHTLNGFLDLLASGALGPLSVAQEQSLSHLYQAASRISELLDTSIDLAEQGHTARTPELTYARLSSLVGHQIHGMMRERPGLCLSVELDIADEAPTLVEQGSFRTVLTSLVGLLTDNVSGSISLRIGQTDLHTSLTLYTPLPQDTPTDASVTQSLPSRQGLSSDFEAMAHDLRNRDYLRLKRCEALLARQRGRLWVSPDLTRVRVMLPNL